MVFTLNGSCVSEFTPSNDKVTLEKRNKGNYVPIESLGSQASVDYVDPSFVQQHQTCIIQEDVDNEYIKQRNFFNSPGGNDYIFRPAIQNCLPTEINSKRNGNIEPHDGLAQDMTNNINPNIESDLRGLWQPGLGYCRTKKDLKLNQCSSIDNYCKNGEISDELDEVYQNTTINKRLFDNQNNKFYHCGVIDKETPIAGNMFINNTRAKLTMK
jgi:hypothetical protein